VRKFSVPCAESACSGRVEVLFVAKRDSSRNQDIHVIGNTSFADIPCTIGRHSNSGRDIAGGLVQCVPDPDWQNVR
jgi:hypothetical protein